MSVTLAELKKRHDAVQFAEAQTTDAMTRLIDYMAKGYTIVQELDDLRYSVEKASASESDATLALLKCVGEFLDNAEAAHQKLTETVKVTQTSSRNTSGRSAPKSKPGKQSRVGHLPTK